MPGVRLRCVSTPFAFAGCESYNHHDHATASKPYPLKTCIVTGESLGKSPVTRVVNGQAVKFCCSDCIKDFDANPQKYLTKLK